MDIIKFSIILYVFILIMVLSLSTVKDYRISIWMIAMFIFTIIMNSTSYE